MLPADPIDIREVLLRTRASCYKTVFMLNSVEYEILNAHKYKHMKNFSFFSDSDNPRMLFLLLINVKMPTFVGILTFMSRKNSCSIEHKKHFITSGPVCWVFLLSN